MSLTTTEHFEIFKNEAEKWIVFFSLLDWAVYFFHEDNATSGPCRAWSATVQEGKAASLGLSLNWNDDNDDVIITDYDVKKSAFHEVCELLLRKLWKLADTRYGVTESDVEEELHSVIRRLENSVWKGQK